LIGCREAISNMLLHRDLSKFKKSVYSKIIIYKDRLVFRNVGNLYGNNTMDKIMNSESNVEVRNETLVELVETLGGIIENRHTGIKTMVDEMKEAKLPKPVFSNEREDFVVTFYNGEYPELYPEELSNLKEKESKGKESKGKESKGKESKGKESKEAEIKARILEYCKEARNLKSIAEYLGYGDIYKFKKNYVNELIENNNLKLTIPDKPNSRLQKYITNK